MTSIIESFPQLAVYQTAFLALAILCVIVMVQNFLTAPLAFLKNEQAPGMPLKGDHSLMSFRVLRTHSNSVESMPSFGFALLVAIIAGVGASVVNWLAVIYVFFRMAYWAVYYSGTGKVAGGARTMMIVGGLMANLVLAGAALFALI